MARKRFPVLKLFYFIPLILMLFAYLWIGFMTSFPSVKLVAGFVCLAASLAMIFVFWRKWWGYLPILLLVAWMVLIERHAIVLAFFLLFLCGLLLANHRWWGCIPGVLLGVATCIYGMMPHGQIFAEWPIGVVLIGYYLLCGLLARSRKKKTPDRAE